MAIFKYTKTRLQPLDEISFSAAKIRERDDLQKLLKENIHAIADDVLIIAEEFCDWTDSERRIDLLGVDRNANLVVLELKRGDTGAHMELQAIRYAAMVSNMTFIRAVETLASTLGEDADVLDVAQSKLLEFFGWDEPREDGFAQDVRIVLVSAEFSKELTTAVLWLNQRDMDIRCVRMKPYMLEDEVFVDVQQVVPLPEASEYQVGVREKAISRRESVRQSGSPTGYWFMNVGDGVTDTRNWRDCRKYGFMQAGGGERFTRAIQKLQPGFRLFAYRSGDGYVGFGEVTTAAVPLKDFIPPGSNQPLIELAREAAPSTKQFDESKGEYCVGIRWLKTLEPNHGVLKADAKLAVVAQIKTPDSVKRLLAIFDDSHGQPDSVPGATPNADFDHRRPDA